MIRVPINQEMIEDCFNFASSIILGNDQYNRIPSTTERRIERTFVGKLAELCFLNFLNGKQKNYPQGTMFTIFPGQTNTDGYDFITRDDESTVDVKSASKPFHSRIMVPIDQFRSVPKDYYVGVRINSKIDKKNNDKILIHTIKNADIFGYCTYQDLDNMPTQNFGYPCKAIDLNKLRNIYTLLNKF